MSTDGGTGPLDETRAAAVTSPPPGEPAVIELDEAAATNDFRVALHGAVAPGAASPTEDVVWIDGDSELLVHPLRARLVLRPALVLAGIPVSTEQRGDAEVVVAFAVGAPGLLMATESRPRGPEEIVTRWGEPLIAAAWDALMAVATNGAAQTDADSVGGVRLPFELRVEAGSLGMVTQPAGTPVGETA